MWLPPCCAQHSHQLDPVTDVCAVVGIWKGVQQQLMNTVCIPGAPIHQRDKDVSHASWSCQDEPWCRIANAFVHPLQRGTACSDLQANSQTSSFSRNNRALYWSELAVFHNPSYGPIYANKLVALTGFLAKEISFVKTDRIFFFFFSQAGSGCGTTKIWFGA